MRYRKYRSGSGCHEVDDQLNIKDWINFAGPARKNSSKKLNVENYACRTYRRSAGVYTALRFVFYSAEHKSYTPCLCQTF